MNLGLYLHVEPMTRSRLDFIRRQWQQAIECQASTAIDTPLLLWGETIRALDLTLVALGPRLSSRKEEGVQVTESTLDRKMVAYRVEVETTNAVKNTTQTCDGKQYLDCRGGMLTVVTDDPAMIMRTLRVKALEKLGPGYVLEMES